MLEQAQAAARGEAAGDAAQIQMLENALNLIQANKPVLGQVQSRANIEGLFKNLQALKFAEIDREVAELQATLIKGRIPNADAVAKNFGQVRKEAVTEQINKRIRGFETVEGQFLKRIKLLNEETAILNTVNEVEKPDFGASKPKTKQEKKQEKLASILTQAPAKNL